MPVQMALPLRGGRGGGGRRRDIGPESCCDALEQRSNDGDGGDGGDGVRCAFLAVPSHFVASSLLVYNWKIGGNGMARNCKEGAVDSNKAPGAWRRRLARAAWPVMTRPPCKGPTFSFEKMLKLVACGQ
jgi:hypothetical protein